MQSKKQHRQMPSSRLKPLQGLRPFHGLLAAAIAALVVMPVAFAGASGGPVATKSASLRQQVKSLKQRVTALESRQTGTSTTTTSAPSGPAGGDLTGTYPNPTIGANKVNSNKVLDESLTGADIAPDSLGVGDIAFDSVGQSELIEGSVRAAQIGSVSAVIGTGVAITGGTSGEASVTCPAGTRLIAGGYAWVTDQAGTSIIASAPDESLPNVKWDVTGRTTNNNTLYPWASCLQA
jgi:hypothetical protein